MLLLFSLPAMAADNWAEREAAAAKELYIPGVRLVSPGVLGVDLAYVTEVTKPGNGKYTCTPMAQAARDGAVRVITASLQKLGAANVQSMGLKYVLLCDTAQAGGRDIGGIPVPPIKLLMLAAGGSGSDAYRERIFFHELYHYLEFTKRGGLQDAAWDKQFDGYGGGYGTPDASSSQLGGGAGGFASAYAQTLPEEDRAEIFSFLMSDAQGLKALATKNQDKVLQAKIAYIETVMKTQFGMK
ncbi:MAG TPA: hypothetical protein PLO23_10155 [Alphaproteobacteria bacterium]|nr:hypothetical protein [Alphaproteobacteria bacterium]